MLIIQPEAEIDITEAYYWYEAKNKNLGKEFVLEVETRFNNILVNPETFQLVFENIRRSLC